MKEGDIVKISFIGKETATGKVFDTTDEKTAKENGIWAENFAYKPVALIVGKGEIIKGIDEAVKEMKVKEEKTVQVAPEKGFGERKAELVKVIPLKEFKSRNVKPVVGLRVNLNNFIGRVQSVSGGRVRVDFNSELAGKTVEYKIKVEEKIEKPEEQVKALFGKYFPFIPNPKIELKKELIELEIPPIHAQKAQPTKPFFARVILENIVGIKKLNFIESFEKK